MNGAGTSSLQSSSEPSTYHLLTRLVSLVYNSTPATSAFYAGILYDLFHRDLLAGVSVAVPASNSSSNDTFASTSTAFLNAGTKKDLRRKRAAATDVVNGLDAATGEDYVNHIEVPRHQALHLYANALLQDGQWYSAIECVRKHVDDGPAIDAGSTGDGLDSSTIVPKKSRSKRQDRLPCIDCALILARACEKLGRYEEGRLVLAEATERNAKAGRKVTTAPLPSPQPDPLLTLASLAAKSNSQDETSETIDISSGASRIYAEAVARDRWSWEAWVGWCDQGLPDDAPEAFSSSTEALPMSTIPVGASPLWPHDLQASTSGPVSPMRKMSANDGIIVGSSPSRRQRSSSTGTESTASHANTTTGTNTASSPPAPSAASGVSSTTSPEERFDPYRDRRLSPLPTRAARASSPALSKMSLGSSTSAKGKAPVASEMWPEPSGTFHPIASSTPMTGGPVDMLAAGDSMHVPSIASRLRPHLPPSALVNFETPDQVGRRDADGGLGLPPVPKRSRKKATAPAASVGDNDDMEMMMDEDSVGGRRSRVGRNATGRNFSGNHGGDLMATDRRGTDAGPQVRRSSRLNGGARQSDTASSEVPMTRPATSQLDSPSSDQQLIADTWLLNLVRYCGNACRHFKRYDARACIALLESLPPKLQEGAWALSLLGRCYYEIANYTAARDTFDRLFTSEPYRSRDTEWYSTVLWHLDDRAALSRLSQHLLSISRELPEAWIAAGNGFALAGEPDEAIRCFRRASLLDPGFAYAYTLAAHEALEMEEFERAVGYYQMAIRTDLRHYNAWYGLGRLYQKMGKMRYAEYHYRRAVEINPSNVILLCCVGGVVEKRSGSEAALEFFDRALTIEPSNKMARFRRIRALVGLKRNEVALTELESLARVSNNEAAVQFLLGKLHVLNGRRSQAQIAFTNARDLNPKLDTAIKSVLESRGDEGEDTSMEGGGDVSSKRKKVDVDLSAI